MVVIEHYDKGSIKIDGHTYSSDLIICPDKIYTNWQRSKTHQISVNDFQFIIPRRPAKLIIGTGHEHQLQIDEFTQSKLKDLGFSVYIARTRAAIREFNSSKDSTKTIGAFCLK